MAVLPLLLPALLSSVLPALLSSVLPALLSSVKNYPQAATDLYHSYHITILIDNYYRSGYPIAIRPS